MEEKQEPSNTSMKFWRDDRKQQNNVRKYKRQSGRKDLRKRKVVYVQKTAKPAVDL